MAISLFPIGPSTNLRSGTTYCTASTKELEQKELLRSKLNLNKFSAPQQTV